MPVSPLPCGLRKVRRSKYGAKRCTLDGHKFDSQAERDEYARLKLRMTAGEIQGLEVHPRFPLVVNGERICIYESDFTFLEVQGPPPKAIRVVLDVKGFVTPEAKIKMALFKALYPDADFREVHTDKDNERRAWTAVISSRVVAGKDGR